MPGPPSPPTRRWWGILALVAAAGVAVRALYVQLVMVDTPSGQDSIWYQLQGGAIRDGVGYVTPTSWFSGELVPTAAFPPAYPAYQALWQTVIGESPTTVRLSGLVPAVLTIVLVALLARRLVGDGAALVAAGLVAAHPGLIAVDGSAMSENLTVPLVLGAQVLALGILDRALEGDAASGARWLTRSGALGLVLGVGILTRQDLMFFSVLLVAWLVFSLRLGWRRLLGFGAAVGVGIVVVVVPWMVRNERAVDVFAVSTLSPGSALAGANCPGTYHGPDLGSWDYDCVVAARPGAMSEEELAAASISEGELVDAYEAAARHQIADDTSRIPVVVAAREARVWSWWDPRDLARRDADESRHYGWQVRTRPLEAVLALVGVAGLVGLVRRRGARALVLAVPVVAVAVSAALGYGNPRFAAIAQPSLAVGAVVVLGALVRRYRHPINP